VELVDIKRIALCAGARLANPTWQCDSIARSQFSRGARDDLGAALCTISAAQ